MAAAFRLNLFGLFLVRYYSRWILKLWFLPTTTLILWPLTLFACLHYFVPPHNEISDKSKLSFHGVNECEVLLLFQADGANVKFRKSISPEHYILKISKWAHQDPNILFLELGCLFSIMHFWGPSCIPNEQSSTKKSALDFRALELSKLS